MLLQEVVTQAAVVQPKQHSHILIAMWVAVAVALVEAVLLWITVKARGGWAYVATIPITNLRSLVAIALFAVAIVGTGVIGYLAGVWPPDHIFTPALTAVTVWAGIEVTGVWLKRVTTNENLPSTQNIMAAQAAIGLPVDARTAREAAAPQARQPVPGPAPEFTDFPTLSYVPAERAAPVDPAAPGVVLKTERDA